MITRAKAAPGQSRSADLIAHTKAVAASTFMPRKVGRLTGPTSARCMGDHSAHRGRVVRMCSGLCAPAPTGGCGGRRHRRAMEAVPRRPPVAPGDELVHRDGMRGDQRRVWPHSCPDDRVRAIPCRLPGHTGPVLPRIQPTSALPDGDATHNLARQGREELQRLDPLFAKSATIQGQGRGPEIGIGQESLHAVRLAFNDRRCGGCVGRGGEQDRSWRCPARSGASRRQC